MSRIRPLQANEGSQPDEPSAPPPISEATESKATRSLWFELFSLSPDVDDGKVQELINRQLKKDIEASPLSEKYNLLVLYETTSLERGAANRIYQSLSSNAKDKPILLILSSAGGDVAAAYFIAKLCREHTPHAFEVAVPRRAKSAATLICCGADKIHMGSLSELGPIDPQFGGIPALALKHSVEHIAELVGKYPGASRMFSDYLEKSLRLDALGFFERVAASATQYAVRLLNSRSVSPTSLSPNDIAQRLVYDYKDHGFVIDSREALEIFSPDVVVCNTEEYRLSNSLFEKLDLISWICDDHLGRNFSFVGSADQDCWVSKKT